MIWTGHARLKRHYVKAFYISFVTFIKVLKEWPIFHVAILNTRVLESENSSCDMTWRVRQGTAKTCFQCRSNGWTAASMYDVFWERVRQRSCDVTELNSYYFINILPWWDFQSLKALWFWFLKWRRPSTVWVFVCHFESAEGYALKKQICRVRPTGFSKNEIFRRFPDKRRGNAGNWTRQIGPSRSGIPQDASYCVCRFTFVWSLVFFARKASPHGLVNSVFL